MVKSLAEIQSSQRKKWQKILRGNVGKTSHGVPVVIDSNVLISAIIFGGAPERAVLLCVSRFRLSFSFELLDEVRNYLRNHSDASRKFVKLIEDSLLNIGTLYELSEFPIIVRDPKDNHLIALAIKSGSEMLITGDKDLLILGSYEGILICSPSDFLEFQ